MLPCSGFVTVVTVVELVRRSTMVTTVATVMISVEAIASHAQIVRCPLSRVQAVGQPSVPFPEFVLFLATGDDETPETDAMLLLEPDDAATPEAGDAVPVKDGRLKDGDKDEGVIEELGVVDFSRVDTDPSIEGIDDDPLLLESTFVWDVVVLLLEEIPVPTT